MATGTNSQPPLFSSLHHDLVITQKKYDFRRCNPKLAVMESDSAKSNKSSCVRLQRQIKNRRILMIRRRGRGRPSSLNDIERKVRILKRLVPNCESMGMERLFRETADYIVALQMRVKLMQIMANVLSASGTDHHHQ